MSGYCFNKGILCEYVNEHGQCSITACARPVQYGVTATQNNSHTYSTISEDIATIIPDAEWKMVLDDFDDGVGERLLPHCSNCKKGVYKHDAGRFCTFCGRRMKNPLVV